MTPGKKRSRILMVCPSHLQFQATYALARSLGNSSASWTRLKTLASAMMAGGIWTPVIVTAITSSYVLAVMPPAARGR
jgi:hypothetical protein